MLQKNRSSRTLRLGLFGVISVLPALLLTGCGAADSSSDAAVGESRENLFVGAGVQLWSQNGNQIPLCWATPGFPQEKAIIQNAIQRTWVKATPITPTWREGCPTTGSTQYVKVQIGEHTMVPDGNGGMFFDHSTDGQTRGLGMGALSAPTTQPLNPFTTLGMTIWVELAHTSEQHRMEYVAVHEFGHILGFEHEQNRPEAEARACDPGILSGTVVGPYDRDSVMNYCNAFGNARGNLSEGDYGNVRNLYGARRALVNAAGDFSGDGKADVIAVNDDAVYGLSSSGTSFNTFFQLVASPFYGTRETLFGDLNADGKTDLVAVNGDAAYVVTSTGTSFANFGQWTSSPFFGQRRTLLADVNADGKADLIAINNNGVSVRRSSGTAFLAPVQWATTFFGTIRTFAADVNNDRRADLIAVSNDGVRVKLSNGTSFGSSSLWIGPFYGYQQTLIGDFNNDGRADLFAVNDDGIYVAKSNGSSFNSVTKVANPNLIGNIETMIGDVNGDKRADVIAVNATGDVVGTSNGTVFNTTGANWSGPFYSIPEL